MRREIIWEESCCKIMLQMLIKIFFQEYDVIIIGNVIDTIFNIHRIIKLINDVSTLMHQYAQ